MKSCILVALKCESAVNGCTFTQRQAGVEGLMERRDKDRSTEKTHVCQRLKGWTKRLPVPLDDTPVLSGVT